MESLDLKEKDEYESPFLFSTDIGAWRPYSIFTEEEQKELQKENLYAIEDLFVCEGQLSFIYSKQIARVYEYIEDAFSKIRITDTNAVIEDEIYHTATIEGANTTRRRTFEIHNGAKIREDNYESEKMIENGFKAVKLLSLYGPNLTKEKLTSVWETIVDGCCHNEEIRGEKGEYRNGDIFVGGHIGLNVEKIESYMDNWIAFYNSDYLDEKPFIKAAILHYAFENIHPFCDGNGRTGRLLMNNYLIDRGIEACRAVSFSMEIDKERARYDVSFFDSENEYADCTPFLEYMLEIMAKAADTAINCGNMEK